MIDFQTYAFWTFSTQVETKNTS